MSLPTQQPNHRQAVQKANVLLRGANVAVPRVDFRPGHVPITQWKGAPDADLRRFMQGYGYTGARDFNRRCSEGTFTNRKHMIGSSLRIVMERVRGVKTLSQFTPKYMPELIAAWNERDDQGQEMLTKSSQIQAYSILSWFWKVHGIAAPSIKSWIKDPDLSQQYQRTFVATKDLSWSAAGVNFDDIVARAKAVDPVVARLLILGRTFGLRLNETLRMTPNENDAGDHLKVTKGSKGGRPREISFDMFGDKELREAINAVKDQIKPRQHAAWQGRSLKSARRHFYYVLSKLGITKKQLGVTFHGLRAQWAIEQFERLTDHEAPVRAGGSTINYHRFSEQRVEIARALGHNRISVTSAYFGSFFRMKSAGEVNFRESWRRLSSLLPEIQACVSQLGIANLWWVGSRANGSNTEIGADWEFLCDDQTPEHAAKALEAALAAAVEDRLGILHVHSSVTASEAKKQRWSDNALPLFDVEAPQMRLDNPIPNEPPARSEK